MSNPGPNTQSTQNLAPVNVALDASGNPTNTTSANGKNIPLAQFTTSPSGGVAIQGTNFSYPTYDDTGFLTRAVPHKVKQPASNGSLAVDVTTATLSGVTGTITKSSNQPFSTNGGQSVSVSVAGGGTEVFDLTTNFALTAANKYIGFWAHRTMPSTAAAGGTDPLLWTIYFTGDNFAHFSAINLLLYPGTHYYVIPLPQTVDTNNAWSGFTIPGTVTKIRFRQANGGNAAILYPAGVNTDVVYFGDFYIDPPAPKAKFLVCFDDCKLDLLVPGGASTAVVDGTGATKAHSYASFAASYGFPVNAFVITGGVLSANQAAGFNAALGYLNARELARGRDEYGIAYGMHSHSHPNGGDIVGSAVNTGLRLLGQYGYSISSLAFTSSGTGLSVTPTTGSAGIVNDLTTCADYLNKWGFKYAPDYFALPQGGFDYYVNQAMEQFGFKMVRGTQNVAAHPLALNTTNMFGYECRSSLYTVPLGIQTDNALTQVQIQGYVDYIIAMGGIGANYCHSFAGSSAARQQTKWLFDYLQQKQAAGLIDVVSMYDIY